LNIYSLTLLIIWLLVAIFYPAVISIYGKLPLFIGFAGLVFIKGIQKEKTLYILFSLLYMFSLEINLSLPLFLIVLTSIIYYYFFLDKLRIIYHCDMCINIITVISINIIYLFLLTIYDIITCQSSITYDSFIVSTIIFDILAAVIVRNEI
jgi:hypothetical protein